MRTGRVDRTSRSQANVFRLQVRVLGSSFPRRTDSNHRSAIEREIHIGLEPEVKWVRPDLNRSRQHPKLVGFLVSGKTGGPRAQTKLPHGPAGTSRMIEALKTLPRSSVDGRETAQPNGKTSSMSSAWERIIRRQQYRFSPSSSRTLRGSSPPRVRSMNAGKALPTTLPHVKHRTGMIMGSPVRLLPLLARAAPERLLRELAAGVGDN